MRREVEKEGARERVREKDEDELILFFLLPSEAC